MPQSEFEEYFAELTGKLEALEGSLGASDFAKHFEDLKLQIKMLYEAMRERNSLLTTVLEHSAASIYAKRKDGRYTYLNHEMEALCNVVREQVLGKTDFEVFPREIAQQWRTNDLKTMTTGEKTMTTGELTVAEETIDSPRGKRIVLSKKVPLISPSGEVEGICGISTDITELRRTELALREAVAKLERERDNKLTNVEAIMAAISHE